MQDNTQVWDVAYSPDDRYLATATASKNGLAAVWEISSGRQVARMEHNDNVWDVAYSPDGKSLASGTEDGIARIWAVPSGLEIHQIRQEEEISDVEYSPDGKYLATADQDGSAPIWYLQREDLIEAACSRLTRNLTQEEWHLYLHNEPYRKTCQNLNSDT
jgi:WD40 repeat protein